MTLKGWRGASAVVRKFLKKMSVAGVCYSRGTSLVPSGF
jgi:hypothetical protein